MADRVPNSVPKDGFGGYSGTVGPTIPEKLWDNGPQAQPNDTPAPKGLIPGGSRRPF